MSVCVYVCDDTNKRGHVLIHYVQYISKLLHAASLPRIVKVLVLIPVLLILFKYAYLWSMTELRPLLALGTYFIL